MANLEEVPLGGCSFTWCHRSASKMSKLDRFLMSESLLSECPNLSAITLDRFLSDHRLILLCESTHDYGPILFWFFHYWLEMEGFENFVNKVWRKAPELADLEMIIDKGDASSNTLHKRAEVVKSIQEVDKLCAMEASQKAKIKWAIEGDENSKYYHALISKTPEAKMVKDFRPISLIGSLYKIIAKILANRLVVVLGDIVNEVQSAFVADRQILDGPFILNEVLQWCKLKKKHSFILKIDFEKAYDSVLWDYLDDVLRKFGFGEKWCGWIQECLRSSWGSILVNGSLLGFLI
ncbi:RNA-directed DNA polymerase, eukaryota, reverse transcriptase zinc-binding domain protein [Tanacetum coccineum]